MTAPAPHRSAVRRFWTGVLVAGSVAAAVVAVTTGWVPLLVPALLLGTGYALPPGAARVTLHTLASIALALVAALGGLALLALAAIAGGEIG